MLIMALIATITFREKPKEVPAQAVPTVSPSLIQLASAPSLMKTMTESVMVLTVAQVRTTKLTKTETEDPTASRIALVNPSLMLTSSEPTHPLLQPKPSRTSKFQSAQFNSQSSILEERRTATRRKTAFTTRRKVQQLEKKASSEIWTMKPSRASTPVFPCHKETTGMS
jgi:hypothetical protein